MNTKTLLGGLIAGIVTFLLGWLIYGNLLMDYFNSHSAHYDGLMKDPEVIWEIGIANLVWGLLLAFIFSMSGVKSVSKGFTTGFIIFLLSTLGSDLLAHGLMNLWGYKLIAIDVICSAAMGGIAGAALGWWFGRSSQAAAA